MRQYAKLECDNEEYSMIQNVQRFNKTKTKEQFIGSRKKLFSNNEIIATTSAYNGLSLGDISKNQFYSFLGAFNKQLYNQFKKNNDLYSLDIDFKGASRDKNYTFWNEINEGDFFYNLDLKSAYWQVAHKLGYFNEKMFNRYFVLDEYKMAKRLCISFLARRNRMIYYIDGDKKQIDCNTDVFLTVYKNIRHYLYNSMFSCIHPKMDWIEYNIDGITITSKDLDYVKDYFNNLGLKYKITECRKVNAKQYLYGQKIRTFKNR